MNGIIANARRSVATATAVVSTALLVAASVTSVHAAESGSAPDSTPVAWNEEFAYLTGMQAYSRKLVKVKASMGDLIKLQKLDAV